MALICSTSTQARGLQSASYLPQPSSATTTKILSPNGAAQSPGLLLASHPCKTPRHVRNALDFLDVPRSLPQGVLSRSGTSPVPRIIYTRTNELLCARSAATSPASSGIWQAVPLTTPMEIPAKQAVSQIPLAVPGRQHVWGNPDVWETPRPGPSMSQL